MRLAICVCPNGLGHYRRTMLLAGHLLKRLPSLELDIFCAAWQKEAKSSGLDTQARFHHGFMEPGVEWLADAGEYSEERLNGWMGRLKNAPALQKADLVLSDNLGAVLEIRPDAVLSGSFLWSDVLSTAYPKNTAIQRFAEHERRLLKEKKPSMLCVKDAAMPGVLGRTQAVPLGWFCETQNPPRAKARTDKPVLAFLGGATGAVDQMLAGYASKLSRLNQWTIALPPKLAKILQGTNKSNIIPFNFERKDFENCWAVLGRPGMGTISECLGYGLPMIAFHEPGNIEMEYLGQRLEALHCGRYLGAAPAFEKITQTLEEISQGAAISSIAQNIFKLDRNGLEQACDWILKWQK